MVKLLGYVQLREFTKANNPAHPVRGDEVSSVISEIESTSDFLCENWKFHFGNQRQPLL